MSNLRDRIVQRFQARTATISIGETVEKGTVRIHRYANSLIIWNLTNAGKHGKQVERLEVVFTNSRLNTDLLHDIGDELESCTNFGQTKTIIEDFLKKNPDSISVSFYQERGIDVYPAGFKEISITNHRVRVDVGYKNFRVRDLDDQSNEPTCIPSIKGGKKLIPVFYRWVQDNLNNIKQMSFRDVLNQMDKLGIPYHYYCAVD
jgi:hypothetical protein